MLVNFQRGKWALLGTGPIISLSNLLLIWSPDGLVNFSFLFVCFLRFSEHESV